MQLSRSAQTLGSVSIEVLPFSRQSSGDYLQDVAIALGGMAAEREVLGSHDDGAGGGEESDLVKATYLATLAVACFGMGRTLVSESYLSTQDAAHLRRTNPIIWREVDKVMRGQLDRAAEIIKRRRPNLECVADQLIATRRLSGDEILQLLSSTSTSNSIRPAH
jgi:ATP-dependent Zn protease